MRGASALARAAAGQKQAPRPRAAVGGCVACYDLAPLRTARPLPGACFAPTGQRHGRGVAAPSRRGVLAVANITQTALRETLRRSTAAAPRRSRTRARRTRCLHLQLQRRRSAGRARNASTRAAVAAAHESLRACAARGARLVARAALCRRRARRTAMDACDAVATHRRSGGIARALPKGVSARARCDSPRMISCLHECDAADAEAGCAHARAFSRAKTQV